MEYVDVDGLRIAYRRAGSGPPLVLLHGALADSRVWRRQVDEFSEEFTVVAWDAPGCGGSSDPPESFRLADYADCLARCIDALGIGPAHVVGHSFGGALALALAGRHPGAVRSLVLVGAYAGWGGSLDADEVRARVELALRHAAAVEDEGAPPSLPGIFSDRMTPETADELVAMMAEARPAATRTMALGLAEADLRPVLPEIEVPALLLYGDADERAPRSVREAIDEAMPDATLVLLPGVGHMVAEEAPDRFVDEVRRFVATVT